ncbi:cyclic-di-AMP receptor [Christensenellaceae bacterium OttesenSCG-928-L17]|nr:cyclic-di-AMP receptor [Christensenellaceae bacterium OttesenSCG-928-L17]
MKLLFAIVQNEDEKPLTAALVEHDISVTRVSSAGGFLRSGNATLMIGVDASRLQDTLDIIQSQSHRRKSMAAVPAFHTRGTEHAPMPMPITVGGATVFVVDVEAFHKF